jgi:16S rRNA (uracil1498-N3)-methyltransferase
MLPAAALELVLSRCTEAGAAGFVLIDAERSVARGSKPDRWRSICREAAMLAGRLAVPDVAGPLPFARAWAGAERPWLLDRGGEPIERSAGGATLFVGPEGGWSPAERALAGDRTLRLGPRNLRADTAALVGLALALGPA